MLRFECWVEGFESDTFVVREYEGHESISDSEFKGRACSGFYFQIELASRRCGITAADIVDKKAELTTYQDGELVQRVTGIVRCFTRGDTGYHHTFYSITLVPALERLSLRHNSRIFQRKTVPEIIAALLSEMSVTDYEFALRREYAQREFCVQYRETDLAFIHRLAAEEGIVYRFEHFEGKHLLSFSDASRALPKLEQPVLYHTLSGGTVEQSFISTLNIRKKHSTGSVELKDYSFKKPKYSFAQQTDSPDFPPDYRHFDAPGRYKDDENGKAFSRIRLEYLRREAHIATGRSNHTSLRAGTRIELDDPLDLVSDKCWTVVEVAHKGTQPQALEESGTDGATTYRNSFKLIPANLNWQAAPQVKPQVDGPMIAIVTGPEGEEIYCDEHGRVKVHFLWDRYSGFDESSSCWIRVAQQWAGSEYGMMALPRVGHEVIVEFLNGDPDQPIVTGCTYHALNIPPYELPENKTKTVLRTRTHQGEGFNELSFEDQADKEQIYLHAQKDFHSDIKNDQCVVIGNDKHQVIENDSYMLVKNNRHQTVDGDQRSYIKEMSSLEVGGSIHQKTASQYVLDSGREVHLAAGNKAVIDAGTEITISAGGSFIKIDPAGVHLVGPQMYLNIGSTPGKGSGYCGQKAVLPLDNESADSPEPEVWIPSSPALKQQVTADLKSATAITQVCQKQPDGSCPLPDCPCREEV